MDPKSNPLCGKFLHFSKLPEILYSLIGWSRSDISIFKTASNARKSNSKMTSGIRDSFQPIIFYLNILIKTLSFDITTEFEVHL